MPKKAGSLLERNVAKVLKNIGLKPLLNHRINRYEIDVYVEFEGKKIAFECKQREKGSVTVRNLIHEWNSKNNEISLDKIVIVLYGVSPTNYDYELARKYNISIISEDSLEIAFEESYAQKEKYLDEFFHEFLEIDTDQWKEERKLVLERLEEARKTRQELIEKKRRKMRADQLRKDIINLEQKIKRNTQQMIRAGMISVILFVIALPLSALTEKHIIFEIILFCVVISFPFSLFWFIIALAKWVFGLSERATIKSQKEMLYQLENQKR